MMIMIGQRDRVAPTPGGARAGEPGVRCAKVLCYPLLPLGCPLDSPWLPLGYPAPLHQVHQRLHGLAGSNPDHVLMRSDDVHFLSDVHNYTNYITTFFAFLFSFLFNVPHV